MEVVDLRKGFDKELFEELRGFLGKCTHFGGKEDLFSALSRFDRTNGSYFHNEPTQCTILVLVGPCMAICGAVFVEYDVDLNCGLVRWIFLKDTSDRNGRLLTERILWTLNKYSQAHGNEKVKETFTYTARVSKSENQEQELQCQHMCLYDAGFRLVDTKCLETPGRHTEDFLLLVHRPDFIPNYQVEGRVWSDCVKRVDVLDVCGKLFQGDQPGEVSNTDLSQLTENLMLVKESTSPEVLAVSPSFPWHGECGPSPAEQVVVVGAGISGLAAASALSDAGFSVVLLEAANYIGGRVKQVQPFPGFPPVDLGGEFLHGSNTITMRLAKENKWEVKMCHGGCGSDKEVFYLNRQLYFLRDGNHAVQAAHKAWDDIIATGEGHLAAKGQLDKKYYDYMYCPWKNCESGCLVKKRQEDHIIDGGADVDWGRSQMEESCESGKAGNGCLGGAEDMSLLEFLKRRGCSDDAVAVFEARYAQTEGGCLDKLGVYECTREEMNWDYGSHNFRLEGSYSLLIRHYLDKCKAVDKRLDWQVKEVIWKDTASSCEECDAFHCQNRKQQVTLKSQLGQALTAKHVVITVPLTVLKEGDITFTPRLPPSKQTAINTIQMRGALKLVCRFRTPFWGEHVALGNAARGFLSQIWMFSPGPNDGEQCHVIAGFQTAELAERKVNISEEEMLERFLHQLDDMFGTPANSTPASENFMDHVYYHWSKNPFVRGGYSSPTVHAYGLRHELAKPVDTSLFFAGEATSIKCAATVHSAIETGIRAAGEVCHAAGKCSEAGKLNIT